MTHSEGLGGGVRVTVLNALMRDSVVLGDHCGVGP